MLDSHIFLDRHVRSRDEHKTCSTMLSQVVSVVPQVPPFPFSYSSCRLPHLPASVRCSFPFGHSIFHSDRCTDFPSPSPPVDEEVGAGIPAVPPVNGQLLEEAEKGRPCSCQNRRLHDGEGRCSTRHQVSGGVCNGWVGKVNVWHLLCHANNLDKACSPSCRSLNKS